MLAVILTGPVLLSVLIFAAGGVVLDAELVALDMACGAVCATCKLDCVCDCPCFSSPGRNTEPPPILSKEYPANVSEGLRW